MKKIFITLSIFLTVSITLFGYSGKKGNNRSAGMLPDATENNAYTAFNRPPLQANCMAKLPLGSIHAQGWLRSQLELQRDGLTGKLNEFWLQNDWWQGGNGVNGAKNTSKPHIVPNWLEGLIPLAFQLNDTNLKAKLKPYIEFALTTSRRPDGRFGPLEAEEPPYNEVLDLGRLRLARGLIEYYEATKDQRVIETLSAYFLKYLASNAEHIHDWLNNTNLQEALVSGIWLYNQTGNAGILEVCQAILAKKDAECQWLRKGLEGDVPVRQGYAIAHGVKYPALQFLLNGNPEGIEASNRMLGFLDDGYGQIGGRFAAAEWLPLLVNEPTPSTIQWIDQVPWYRRVQSGRDPSNATELCDVVELMYSMEQMYSATGNNAYADRLESLAFNSLPGSCTGDFWSHQYDTQANQIMVNIAPKPFDNSPDATIYGLMPNYDCCLANMHQGWPRLAEHLWMKTQDGGLASIIPAACEVNTTIADGISLRINTTSEYPFDGTAIHTIQSLEHPATFPLYIRLPGWAAKTVIEVNGKSLPASAAGSMVRVERKWRQGDVVRVSMPMPVRFEERRKGGYAIMRGPLYYVLRIAEQQKMLKHYYQGSADWEFLPTSAWNVALRMNRQAPGQSFSVERNSITTHPFAHEGEMIYQEPRDKRPMWDGAKFSSWKMREPIVLKGMGQIVPEWKPDPDYPIAADPTTITIGKEGRGIPVELIPYGCSRLRIAEFPVVWIDSGE